MKKITSYNLDIIVKRNLYNETCSNLLTILYLDIAIKLKEKLHIYYEVFNRMESQIHLEILRGDEK